MSKLGLIGAPAAALAALSLASTPAAAIDLPVPQGAAIDRSNVAVGSVSEYHRRYRHRDRGVNAGDIIAGVVVLGAVAAIASAVGNNRAQPRRFPAEPPRDRRAGTIESRGIANAVDMCVSEVERGRVRVAGVDEAVRDAGGWRVSGALDTGEGFECRIGNDGRIHGVDLGQLYGADFAQGQGAQYSDEVYARIRAAQGARPSGYTAPDRQGWVDEDIYDADPRPAYPGGPLPGEAGYDDAIRAVGY